MFFPLTDLPAFMQMIAEAFLILTHLARLTRALAISKLESTLLLSLIWISVATPVFFIPNINLMKRNLIK